MLCRAHHRQIETTDWIVRIRDGLPEFLPPAWIDANRTPRRKPLPHLVRDRAHVVHRAPGCRDRTSTYPAVR
jgi:hypothetical protein